jgi:hypothetical protein
MKWGSCIEGMMVKFYDFLAEGFIDFAQGFY